MLLNIEYQKKLNKYLNNFQLHTLIWGPDLFLTLLLLIFFVLKMISAFYVSCIFSEAFFPWKQTYTMNPDQTAPEGEV